MIDKISDFQGLSKHVEESELPYREAIIDYYTILGEKLGFTARPSASMIMYGVNLGKIDLVWVEPDMTFTVEFGSLTEMIGHLVKISEKKPEKAVIITSSKSQCKPSDVKKIIVNSHLMKEIAEDVILLDVSAECIVHP